MLIKVVSRVIPIYCMNAFLIHVSIADEIQSINSFLWGTEKNGERGMSWLS